MDGGRTQGMGPIERGCVMNYAKKLRSAKYVVDLRATRKMLIRDDFEWHDWLQDELCSLPYDDNNDAFAVFRLAETMRDVADALEQRVMASCELQSVC
jgi:hypothetical protein